jgi:WD40 repeat protein
MKQRIVFAVFAAVLSIIASPVSTSGQSVTFHYAFAQHDADSIDLYAVDPNNPTRITFLQVFPLGTDERVWAYGNFSPNGKLLPVFINESGIKTLLPEVTLRLFNAEDGSVLTVASGIFGVIPLNNHFWGKLEVVQWSPDGRYLAILARPNGFLPNLHVDANSDIFLYDTQTQITRNITADPHSHGRFAWSPDGQKLAFATVICAEQCIPHLEILDVFSGNRTHSSPISIAGGMRAEESLCLLNWSPDSQKLVYRVNCEVGLFYYQELHVFNLITELQERLTYYTAAPETERDTSFYVAYQFPIWHDANLILVGGYNRLTIVSTEHVDENGFIESYDLSTGQQADLVGGKLIYEWSHSIQAGQYIVAALTSNAEDFDRRSVTASTHLIQYANGELQILGDLPAGCNFNWSPDRRHVMYYLRSENPYSVWTVCYDESRVFWDANTRQITHWNDMTEHPLGWVAVTSSQPTATPTLPPTDLRALYAAYNSAPVTPVLHPSVVIRNHSNAPVPLSPADERLFLQRLRDVSAASVGQNHADTAGRRSLGQCAAVRAGTPSHRLPSHI